ncbi:MAG: nucleoside deaminase, partial [Synergistaceae bacterium]|nr:nucleoside deaminase [Synergistaceae bacterium]
MTEDYYYMTKALDEAQAAFRRGDVPVGAIIVRDNQIISSGSDLKYSDPTEHAEIIAIRSCA